MTHEDWIANICAFAGSEELVFAPDDYKKGNATREPADLAWALGDVVVLLNLTAGVGGREVARNEHNLGPLQGWLRMWRRGQPLAGKTRTGQTRRLEWNDVRHVVLISVIDDAEVPYAVRLHPEVTRKLVEKYEKVRLVATIPGWFLLTFCRQGMSMLDLLRNVVRIADGGRALYPVGVFVPDLPPLPAGSIVGLTPDEVHMLALLRSRGGPDLAHVMSDLTLGQLAFLVHSRNWARDHFRKLAPGAYGTLGALTFCPDEGPYLIASSAFMLEVSNFQEIFQSHMQEVDRRRALRPDASVMLMVIWAYVQSVADCVPMIALDGAPARTQTSAFLDTLPIGCQPNS